MKLLKMTSLFLAALILLVLGSCGEGSKTLSPGDNEGERYLIEIEDIGTDYIDQNVRRAESYPFFSQAILERGYRVLPGEAAHFRVIDGSTGELSRVTIIPCALPDDNSRLAMIYYLERNGEYRVTSAEYFESEDYDIAHPLDDAALSLMAVSPQWQGEKVMLVQMSANAKEYWKCVAKRFAAGCLGCALKCYLTGPGWGPCTSACCAGVTVVALISCWFEIAGG